MRTITINEWLKNPIIIQDTAGANLKRIMYIYADAFTVCDCGKELKLTQTRYGDNTYRGLCSCKRKWTLLNNKFTVE